MRLEKLWRWGLTTVLAGSAALFAAVPAGPGVVNFVEGQASIDGRGISGKSVGDAQLQRGDVLQTTDGRAEILLSPGVFLRIGRNSQLRMDSTDLLDTRVALERGSAMVEADNLHKEGAIRIADAGSMTTLMKKGIYRFSADTPSVAVYDGKAQVMENDRVVEVKSGHEVNLTAPVKSTKFDKKATEEHDDLYAWSKLRSEYLSEASAATARTYVVNNWGGWYGAGWYWNPMFSTYAWLPGDPVFYSPFGWCYYSPFAYTTGILYAPGYYGYRAGHYYTPGRAVAGINPGFRNGVGTRSAVAAPRMGVSAGMRPAMGGMHMGGMGRVGGRGR
jgi:hypothetical protein